MPELEVGATDELIRALDFHYKLVRVPFIRLHRRPEFRAAVDAACSQGQDPELTETLLIIYQACELFRRSDRRRALYKAARKQARSQSASAVLRRQQFSERGISRYQARLVLGYCVNAGANSLSREKLRPLAQAFAAIHGSDPRRVTEQELRDWIIEWVNVLHVRLINTERRESVERQRLNNAARGEFLRTDAILRSRARPGVTRIGSAPLVRVRYPQHRT